MPFLNTRPLKVSQRGKPTRVDILAVGPGGSGYSVDLGGGGGAGGVYYKPLYTITPGATYTVVVPAGGSGSNTTISGTGVDIKAMYGGTGGDSRSVSGGSGASEVSGQAGGSGGGGGYPTNFAKNLLGGAGLQPYTSETPLQDDSTGGYGNTGGTGTNFNWLRIGGGGGAASGARDYDISGVYANCRGGLGYYIRKYARFGEDGFFGGGGNAYSNGSGSNGVGDIIAPSPGGGGGQVSTSDASVRNGKPNTGGGGAGPWNGYYGIGGSGVVIFSYPPYYKYATSTTGSPTVIRTREAIIYVFTGSGTIVF